jgi:ATP-dependent exoDNAse (exonuclease V) beta subunit
MTGPSSDAEARRIISHFLDETLVVEAAAGTGKTTEMIARILQVLAAGRARMDEIVAVTFTEKAAGELKLRLRESLEEVRGQAQDRDVRDRLALALQTLEEAHVNTIHGFCAELLRERPVEAGVDPLFTVLTEPQADRTYARAFRAWLQATLEDPTEGTRRALRRGSAPASPGSGRDGPIDRLRTAGRTLARLRDFPCPWTRPPFDRQGAITALISMLHAFADLTRHPASDRDVLYADTDGVRRLSDQIKLEASFGRLDFDAWEARLVDLVRDRGLSRTRKGSGFKFGKDVTRSALLSARDAFVGDLQRFRQEADADLAAALQTELSGVTERYQAGKRTAGALDYDDLLARTRDLLKGNVSVRRHLQEKFKRIFVDEFQDTDPVQAEILLLLAADDPAPADPDRTRSIPGKLFIVGDPKQAIYRFRGADVGTYRRVTAQLAAGGGRVLQLTKNYRSLPALQEFVNAAFATEMVADEVAMQADYVPLAPYRAPNDSQPAVVALPVPKPYGRGFALKPSASAIEESLPDAVGAFIAWLTDEANGWQVSERLPEGERLVPLRARHIALLFRRFVNYGEDVTRRYVEAIEARGIPHLLVGGRAFHDREEVEMVRAALTAIEWPDDELSVFATLKGALYAIDDEHLLEYRQRFGALHPFRIPAVLGGNSGADFELGAEPTSHLKPIADGLRLLQSLHRGRNYRPVADTVGRLMTETRAHTGLVVRPGGEQALANVLHIAELARRYEADGGISFRGFIDELRGAAESPEAAEAPILEEGSDGVRLMTVHKAKGLEFPVVILADLTCRMCRDTADRYLDASRGLCAVKLGGWSPHDLHEHQSEEVARDRAEGVRLAYVAATRARDLLVVPALGDGAWDGGWFGPLNRALYPPLASRRQAARGPNCPVFRSGDSVIERPNDELAGAHTVRPGQHAFAGYSVVWWDPAALALGMKPTFGVRHRELISKDADAAVVAEGRRQYDRWRASREAARAAGSTPSIAVEAVGEWLAGHDDAAPFGMALDPDAVRILRVGTADELRPRGPAFGSLVHAVLAQARFDADLGVLEASAGVEGRLLGLSDVEAAAAARVVERILAHDILKRAAQADARQACRRETPITYVCADGTLLEGVVDLAFEDKGRWLVVDYKTDRELADRGELRYRRQVAVYASALAQATGKPCDGLVLVV